MKREIFSKSLLGLSLLAVLTEPSEAAPGKFKVMSYNVQNLFDTQDDPNTNDQEFLPKGASKWTEAVLNDKIANLAAVIKAEAPDIVGLSEIENQAVLTQLLERGQLRAAGYVVALAGPSDDARGIRCAILSKFPVVASQSHRVWKDSWKLPDGSVQKTRDIFEVTLNLAGTEIAAGKASHLVTVLVNHWPSRAGGAIRNAMRLEVAQSMSAIVASITAAHPERLVVSVGDFNDELRDESIARGLRTVKNISELAGATGAAFYPLDSELESLAPAQRGTFYFKRDKIWNSLDHIFVAKGKNLAARPQGAYDYVPGSIRIVRPTQFMEQGQFPSGCQMGEKGRSGNACKGGASDHLPMTAEFELR